MTIVAGDRCIIKNNGTSQFVRFERDENIIKEITLLHPDPDISTTVSFFAKYLGGLELREVPNESRPDLGMQTFEFVTINK